MLAAVVGGSADDPAVTAAVRDVVERLGRIDGITEIERRLQAQHRGQTVSEDGRSVVVNFTMPGEQQDVEARIGEPLAAVAAVQRAHPEVLVEQSGGVSIGKVIDVEDEADGKQAEMASYVLTLVILLVAFGAFVAAGIPLVLGGSAVAATIGLLGPLSNLYSLSPSVSRT